MGSSSAKAAVIHVQPEALYPFFEAGAEFVKIQPVDDKKPRQRKLARRRDGADSSMPVTLHVYNAFWIAKQVGLPIHHLGIEVLGMEFSYGDMGVNTNLPGEYDPERYVHSCSIGRTRLLDEEVLKVVQRLHMEWLGEAYALIGRNCQTFAVIFCDRLGLANAIPEKYTRFAGDFLPLGLLARHVLDGTSDSPPRKRTTKISL